MCNLCSKKQLLVTGGVAGAFTGAFAGAADSYNLLPNWSETLCLCITRRAAR